MKLLSVNDRTANNPADNIKGRKNLLKLIPLLKMEITSVLLAILEVKKMTATKKERAIADLVLLSSCGGRRQDLAAFLCHIFQNKRT